MKKNKVTQLALFTKEEFGNPKITVHEFDDMPLLSAEDRMNVEKSKYVLPDRRFRKLNPMVEAYGAKAGEICKTCGFIVEMKNSKGAKRIKCAQRGTMAGNQRLNWPACVKHVESKKLRKKQDELNYQLAEKALENWKSKLGKPGWDDRLVDTEIYMCEKMLKELPKPRYKYEKG